MSAEDTVSVQTRAMKEAQCIEGEVQRVMDNNQEGCQRAVQNTGEIVWDPAHTADMHFDSD